jgi:hypothetical protein
MKRRKLEKLRRELERKRLSPQKANALQKLALRLGRRKVKRGKEPTWESDLPGCYPFPIPDHGGKDLPPGTRNSILNQLEDQDIAAWEGILDGNGPDDSTAEDDDDQRDRDS